MLIVSAKAVTQQGKQEAFVQAAQDCIINTRKEEGNISYRLLHDTEDDCIYNFLEEWVSKEDLDVHMKTAHFQQLGTALQGLLTAPLEIAIYEGNKIG